VYAIGHVDCDGLIDPEGNVNVFHHGNFSLWDHRKRLRLFTIGNVWEEKGIVVYTMVCEQE
jgi:hypothetical protein